MAKHENPSEIVDRVLSSRPCGLLTDIDGTISQIAEHPDAATVEADARDGLQALLPYLDLVAAVSGRSAEDAHRLVGLDGMVYSGNHGMEIWRDGHLERSNLAQQHEPKVTALLDRLRAELNLAGLYFESKGLTASIHVRGTADPERAEQLVHSRAVELAHELGLRITRGRMVVEIRPPIDLNKGTSVIDLIEQFHLHGAVYIGDDVTDVDAFKALQERRVETGDQFYSIGVTGPETPSIVIDTSDALVSGVGGVITLLSRVARTARG